MRGTDQFHQAESYNYFYYMCMAEPTNPNFLEQARRFAGFYLNEDQAALNYDPEHNIIKSSFNGSDGPSSGYFDGEPVYAWKEFMSPYGLPFLDVPGVTSYEDLKDPTLAARMGAVMEERFGKGDTVGNLLVTSLVTNAFLLTGEAKYRQWVQHYVDGWWERAKQNQGWLPDSVGLTGQVGEYLDGKWYGGLYGWSWPHGFYSIGMSAIVAASNAFLLTNDPSYLDLPRLQLNKLLELGAVADIRSSKMSLAHHWVGQFSAMKDNFQTFLIPYRLNDDGWFDYQPVSPIFPTALWSLSQNQTDRQLLDYIRQVGGYDWQKVVPFRTKEDAGHEPPWLTYLWGENESYPEMILGQSYGQVCRRLEQIAKDEEDLTNVPDELVGGMVHHWQNHNPVLTEALFQLTLGAPPPIYNGGLLLSPLRYFDADRQRPGLPLDVAALVTSVEADKVKVKLVNLSPFAERHLIIQAGGLGEHNFTTFRFTNYTGDYPAKKAYVKDTATGTFTAVLLDEFSENVGQVNDKWLEVILLPAREIELELGFARFVNTPTYDQPLHSTSNEVVAQ